MHIDVFIWLHCVLIWKKTSVSVGILTVNWKSPNLIGMRKIQEISVHCSAQMQAGMKQMQKRSLILGQIVSLDDWIPKERHVAYGHRSLCYGRNFFWKFPIKPKKSGKNVKNTNFRSRSKNDQEYQFNEKLIRKHK